MILSLIFVCNIENFNIKWSLGYLHALRTPSLMYVNKSKIKSVGLKASHTSTNIQGGRNVTFENKTQISSKLK